MRVDNLDVDWWQFVNGKCEVKVNKFNDQKDRDDADFADFAFNNNAKEYTIIFISI
jgi:hypothetical protein